MKKLIILAIVFLASGCSNGYTAEDIQEAYNQGHSDGYEKASDELQSDFEKELEQTKDSVYNEGYIVGFGEGQEAGEEYAYSQIQTNSNEWYSERDQLNEEVEKLTEELETLKETTADFSDLMMYIDQMDWYIMTDFSKRQYILDLARDRGEIMMFDEAERIVELIDNQYGY